MKTILYATDCSPNSGLALKYAYRLSSNMKAKLHVLHVYELEAFVTATVRRHSQLELNFAEEQRLLLEEYCEKQLEHEHTKSDVELIVDESSSITKSILNASNRIDADLVVVGIKNYQSLRSYFSENIANKLLYMIEVPLLLLPPEVYFHGLSTLVYATDFEKADILAIKELVAFAKPYGALIKVVHVPRKKETHVERKMNTFEREVRESFFYPELVFCNKVSEDVETGIKQCIKEELPEMLVMLERGHGFWLDRLFQKDMVEVMEGEVSIPLLVYNKKNKHLSITEEVYSAS